MDELDQLTRLGVALAAFTPLLLAAIAGILWTRLV